MDAHWHGDTIMATAGVPPLTTKMKLLKGIRPDRINHYEPTPDPIKLEPPHHVIKETRKEWYRIVPMLDKMGVLGNVDTAALVI
jgi:phage terminase small subunit